VSYLTNPHVDMMERGEEAAFIMRAILAGMRPRSAFVRLPLAPASINLLTGDGPYRELIEFGQHRKRELGGAILNVSILGGFIFSDTPENGLAIIVTARSDREAARGLAVEIAEKAWAERSRFRKSLTPFAEGISMAAANGLDPSRPAQIFADSGDNPGGGGSGATSAFLQALIEEKARGVYYGSFFDPALAEEAHELGVGASFEARFNRNGGGEHDRSFTVPARIAALTDGRFVGRLGLFAGRALDLGPCCLLEIGGEAGIRVVVISSRQQTADPGFFEMFGLDVAEARTVVVKSRGHFRAGFVPWFSPDRVFEIDTKGLTSPVLENFEWKGLARPIYPLDEDVEWHSPA
ncbi:MAG: MlrC C-terminal domain-containing protein, partial [Rhodospirillales bacterium]|nr:MlrC C-terminal domain-containing protein [Rhodospirillales bacterium]